MPLKSRVYLLTSKPLDVILNVDVKHHTGGKLINLHFDENGLLPAGEYPMSLDDLEQSILARGQDILTKLEGQGVSVFKKDYWNGKVMDEEGFAV